MPQPQKIQRWLDLVTELLSRRMPMTFEQIERAVLGYHGKSKATAKRMFERDKRDLRTLGIPIQTIGHDGSEEAAYRLAPKDFYLPYLSVATPRGATRPRRVDRYGYLALAHLSFEPDELMVVAEAAGRVRALGDPALREDADSAMRKLAFDLPVGAASAPDEPRILGDRAPASPKVLEALGDALLARKRVEIDYHSMNADATSTRRVEPYGLFFLSAHWYLAARDLAHGGVRNFRVNRIASARVNHRGAETADYEIPTTFDLREHARSRQAWELGDGVLIDAVVQFRSETGAAMAAAALGEPVPGMEGHRAFAVRRVDVFARWLLSFAGDAVPLSPPEVVEAVRRLSMETRSLYARDGAA